MLHFCNSESMMIVSVINAHSGEGRHAGDGSTHLEILPGSDLAYRHIGNDRIDSRNFERTRKPVGAGGVVEQDFELPIYGGGFHRPLDLLPRGYAEHIAVFNAIELNPHRAMALLIILNRRFYLIAAVRYVKGNEIAPIGFELATVLEA